MLCDRRVTSFDNFLPTRQKSLCEWHMTEAAEPCSSIVQKGMKPRLLSVNSENVPAAKNGDGCRALPARGDRLYQTWLSAPWSPPFVTVAFSVKCAGYSFWQSASTCAFSIQTQRKASCAGRKHLFPP